MIFQEKFLSLIEESSAMHEHDFDSVSYVTESLLTKRSNRFFKKEGSYLGNISETLETKDKCYFVNN